MRKRLKPGDSPVTTPVQLGPSCQGDEVALLLVKGRDERDDVVFVPLDCLRGNGF